MIELHHTFGLRVTFLIASRSWLSFYLFRCISILWLFDYKMQVDSVTTWDLKFALSEIPKFFTATDAHIPFFVAVNDMYIWVFRVMTKQALDADD